MNDGTLPPTESGLDHTIPLGVAKSTTPREKAPEEIGPYQLLRRVGVGGMGEVFEAQQTEPIRRRVALKLIKRGMDTHAVVARFDAERQALAMMEHPCIAKVFDGGSTPNGRPYFVMEFVEGEPINSYCNRHQLNTADRLKLFMRVCEGVQHAHQKAVIHRDLKPSNILVAQVDGKPLPKIIDFGVAKATTERLTDMTMVTELGQMIGTPEYMSPEQANLTDDDIDTRTDVYALGVLLYELLAGALPFDSGQLRKAGFDAVRKIICEQDPPRPSTRFSSLGDGSVGVARDHGCAPKRLRSELKGDLDWITMKALEKDRDRRYETANGLAADIRRHLQFEPVKAGPPSVGYLVSKFVRRHRTGVAIAAVTVTALAAFAVFSGWQAQVIARERDRAEAESAKAGAMNEFLSEMLVSADPWSGGDHEITVVQALDAAVKQLDQAFSGQPEIEASMHSALGRAYLGLGKLEPATEQLERAVQMQTQLQGGQGSVLGNLLVSESKLYQESAKYDQAIADAAQAARIFRDDPQATVYDLVNAYQHQTRNLLYAQRYSEADSVLDLSEDLARTLTGQQSLLQAENLSQRADLVVERDGDTVAAESLSRQAYEFARTIGTNPAAEAIYLSNSAQFHSRNGDFEGALAEFDTTLVLYEKAFGKDHPQYATCLENRGGVLYRLGRVDETFAALKEVMEIRTRNLGPSHVDVVRTGLNMGTVASLAGNYEEALSIFAELKPVLIAARGPDHPDVLIVLRNQGNALNALGRLDEALAVYHEALQLALRLHGDNHPQTARSQADYGVALGKLGRFQDGEKQLLSAFATFNKDFGAEHIQTRAAAKALTDLYDRMGQPRKADRYREISG